MKYKVGDRVRIKSLDWYNENKSKRGNISFPYEAEVAFTLEMSSFCGQIVTISQKGYTQDVGFYRIREDNGVHLWTDEMIEGLVEEETLIERVDDKGLSFNEWLSHKGAFHIPDGYELKDENGNVINTQKIIMEKKKKEYPKTYEECCTVLSLGEDGRLYTKGYKASLIQNFQKLLICRNAYWKIAGEEMGLGKPWEPNWEVETSKYIILCKGGEIQRHITCRHSRVLAFPTAEMRDAFKENFDPDIEICKELL